METTTPTPKIQLYERRAFGDKISAVFSFLRENFKVIFKLYSLFFIPLCIIMALLLNGIFNSMGEKMTGSGSQIDPAALWGDFGFLASYIGEMLMALLGGWILYSLIISLMQVYQERENGLKGIVFADIKEKFFANLRKVLVVSVAIVVLMSVYWAIAGLIAVPLPATLVLTIPLFIVCLIPLFLIYPAYTLGIGEKGIWKSVVWSFRNGIRCWGGTCILLIVCGLLSNIIVGIFAIPWYIVYMAAILSPDSGAGFSLSGGMAVLSFLFGWLMCFGQFLASMIPLLGVVFQYGHMRERAENVTVDQEVQNFDKL